MASLSVQCGEQQFKGIAAILWDKDGTLANSHGFLRELAHQRSQHRPNRCPFQQYLFAKSQFL